MPTNIKYKSIKIEVIKLHIIVIKTIFMLVPGPGLPEFSRMLLEKKKKARSKVELG